MYYNKVYLKYINNNNNIIYLYIYIYLLIN